MKQTYLAIIEQAEDGTFGVFFPDVLGCTSGGDTVIEAMQKAHEALAFYFEDEDMEAPEAKWDGLQSSLSSDFEGVKIAAVTPITVISEGPIKRYNITLPENLVSRIDAVAKNRSAFLAEAARKQLQTM